METGAAATTTMTNPEPSSAPVSSGNPEPIQGITPPSMEELMGVSTPEPTEDGQQDPKASAKEESPPESKPASSEPTGDKPKEKAPPAEPAEEVTEKEADKPPKGFVKLQALHEARGENRTLKEQLAELTAQVEALSKGTPRQPETQPGQDPTPPPAEFKVLSKEEFAAMKEEDPDVALDYLYDLEQYRIAKAESDRQKEREEQEKQTARTIANNAYARMETTIPGLFDEGSTAAAEFATFAEELGFKNDLFFLTNPSTVVLPPGADKPVLLGEMAADLVDMFAGLKTKLAERGSRRETLREEIRAELETELLEKFKTQGEAAFVSVTDLQGTGGKDDGDFTGRALTPEEYAKLSPADQERYLSGA